MERALKIDMSAVFGYPLSIAFTAWKQGVSWINHINQQTFLNDYHEESGLSFEFLLHQPESLAWQRAFPPKILEAVLAFEKQFSKHTFSCLWFVSRSEAAQQLLLSDPILMWLILDHAKTNRLPPDKVWPLFSVKRTELLKLVELPPTKATLKLVSKYQLSEFGVHDITLIRQISDAFSPRQLGRLKQLTRELAIWLVEQPASIDYRFIEKIGDTDIRSLRITLRDTLGIGRQLNQPNIQQRVNNCETIAELNVIHDQLVTLINQHLKQKNTNVTYRTAPLASSDTIQHIESFAELVNEGATMAHCIGGYHARIMQGNYFAFRVLAPERATLGMHYVGDKLKIDQLRLKRNGRPSKETEDAVYWWFENQKHTII